MLCLNYVLIHSFLLIPFFVDLKSANSLSMAPPARPASAAPPSLHLSNSTPQLGSGPSGSSSTPQFGAALGGGRSLTRRNTARNKYVDVLNTEGTASGASGNGAGGGFALPKPFLPVPGVQMIATENGQGVVESNSNFGSNNSNNNFHSSAPKIMTVRNHQN